MDQKSIDSKTLDYFIAGVKGEVEHTDLDALYFATIQRVAHEAEYDEMNLLKLTYNQHKLLKQYMGDPVSNMREILATAYYQNIHPSDSDLTYRELLELTGKAKFDTDTFDEQVKWWGEQDFEKAVPKFYEFAKSYEKMVNTYTEAIKQWRIPTDSKALQAGVEDLDQFADLDEMRTIIEFTRLDIHRIGDLPYGLVIRILLEARAKAHFEKRYHELKYPNK